MSDVSILGHKYISFICNISVPCFMLLRCSQGGNMNSKWPMKKRNNSAVSM